MSVWVGEMVLKKHGNLSSYPQHKHKSGYSAMSVTPALAGRGKWILRAQWSDRQTSQLLNTRFSKRLWLTASLNKK